MATPDSAPIPRCPVPGHENSRVVRGGRYGKPGRQRQLYVCHSPKPGSTAPTHRFAAPLPRPHAATFTGSTDPDVEAEELRGARKYQFSAHDIAAGLVAVSRGASYAAAGQQVRSHASRRWGVAGDRSGGRHGSLVSDWVEVYADALWRAQAPYPDRWPDTVLLGVLPFTVPRPGRSPALAFSAFVALAADPRGRTEVLAVRAGAGTGAGHWAAFLGELVSTRRGTPAVLVGDGSAGLARAVRTAWPDPADRPELWVDEHDLRAAARAICRRHGLDSRKLVLWQRLQRAWRSAPDWAAWRAEAHRYRLPELDRWLARNEVLVRAQLAARDPAASRSRAPVRAVLNGLDSRIGSRRAMFANQARTDLLLRLMALDLSGVAKVHAWTRLICDWLERGDGRPASPQRRIADRNGRSSLRGAGRTR